MNLLTIENLHIYFEQQKYVLKAVDGLDLSVKTGETVALVGESGSGKSMTAYAVLRLVPEPGKIVQGRIQFDDQNLLDLSPKDMQRIRGREIGLIMQDPFSALNPVIRVGEQVAEVVRHHFRYSRKKARADALEMLRTVQLANIEKTYEKYPHQLSGGECQRVLIAIALACRPKLLIADEPTTALDVTIQSQILNLLKSLKQQFNLSMLLITHDLGIVAEAADRVAVMYAGKIVEQATTLDLFQAPQHPYTQLLLNAMPKVPFEPNSKFYKFEIKPGEKELQSDTGCNFITRCPVAQEQCSTTVPLKIRQNGQLVRCIH